LVFQEPGFVKTDIRKTFKRKNQEFEQTINHPVPKIQTRGCLKNQPPPPDASVRISATGWLLPKIACQAIS
jgi:hypothetical protein